MLCRALWTLGLLGGSVLPAHKTGALQAVPTTVTTTTAVETVADDRQVEVTLADPTVPAEGATTEVQEQNPLRNLSRHDLADLFGEAAEHSWRRVKPTLGLPSSWSESEDEESSMASLALATPRSVAQARDKRLRYDALTAEQQDELLQQALALVQASRPLERALPQLPETAAPGNPETLAADGDAGTFTSAPGDEGGYDPSFELKTASEEPPLSPADKADIGKARYKQMSDLEKAKMFKDAEELSRVIVQIERYQDQMDALSVPPPPPQPEKPCWRRWCCWLCE